MSGPLRLPPERDRLHDGIGRIVAGQATRPPPFVVVIAASRRFFSPRVRTWGTMGAFNPKGMGAHSSPSTGWPPSMGQPLSATSCQPDRCT